MRRPGRARAHVVVLGALALVAAVVAAIFFFRSIVAFFEAYHTIFVLLFLAAVSLWTYWVIYALIRRTVDRSGEHVSGATSSTD